MLNYEYPPIGGGGSNFNYYLLKEFSQLDDLNIDLVTSSETGSDQVIQYSSRIKIHRLNINKKAFHYWTQTEVLSYLFRAYFFCAKLIHKNNYNLIHAIFGFPSGLIAYLLRRKLPYLISLRGSDVPGFNKRFSNQYILLRPLFRLIWEKADLVYTNSAGLRNLALQTTPNQPIHIIYNGVNTNEFTPVIKKSTSGPLRILCVSRLIERKGINYLIDATAYLEKAGIDCRLRIVGEGNILHDLRNQVAGLNLNDKVEFIKRVDHSQLPGYYQEADVFALPSKNEGMSNTVLEAIATGLPIITTETGGTKELMDRNGMYVAQENSHSIAQALIHLAENPQERLDMGRRSRKIAKKFSWADVALKYRESYLSIIPE